MATQGVQPLSRAFLLAGLVTGMACQKPASPPADACVANSCASLQIVCGRAHDGCGQILECGACEVPPGPDAGLRGCVPTTCAAQGRNCDRVFDGCGALLTCGTCTGATTCGKTGLPGVCVPCTETTDAELCAALGAECGVLKAIDGCNRVRTAQCPGTCTAPETCGGGGAINGCGCTQISRAQLCQAAGASCGSVSKTDNCGVARVEQCGACSDFQVCGGGGVPNVCSCPIAPTAALCADAGVDCGPLEAKDACAIRHTVSCGSCSAPQSCGGGGTAGRCGVCPPKSDATLCLERGSDCGTVSVTDNCGALRMVSCGTCPAPQACGGAGVPNSCPPNPFCVVESLPPADAGWIAIPTPSALAPLCGGEVLFGNADSNSVDAIDVFSGIRRGRYLLSARPVRLVVDRTRGTAYVALANSASFATINLVDGGVSSLPLQSPAADFAIGNSGRLFVALDWPNPSVAIVDTTAKVVEKTIPVSSADYLAFNRSSSQLITTYALPGTLYRYAFDPVAVGLTLLETEPTSSVNCGRLEISPDDAHLALSCGRGNFMSYRTTDFEPTNLATVYGEWDIGPYPVGGVFTSDSQRFVSSNGGGGISMYSVANHTRLAAFSTRFDTICTYSSFDWAGVSRQGKVLFGLTVCGPNHDSGRIYWWLSR